MDFGAWLGTHIVSWRDILAYSAGLWVLMLAILATIVYATKKV